MHRILIIGSGGAGKSTLAAELGRMLGIPVIHLDALYWNPGWVNTPAEQMRGIVKQALAGERWIIDGNFRSTLPQRLAAADTVIFLDFPRFVCLWRICKRMFRYYGQTRPDMAIGCPEQFDFIFVQWVWDFPEQERPKVLELLHQQASGKRVFILRSAAEVRRFMEQLSR